MLPAVGVFRVNFFTPSTGDTVAKINPDTDELPTGEGTKYHRAVHGWEEGTGKPVDVLVDVYAVLDGFGVECPAVAHAVKKLIAAGVRGQKGTEQDLREAHESIGRAIQMSRRQAKRADRIRAEAEKRYQAMAKMAKVKPPNPEKKPAAKG